MAHTPSKNTPSLQALLKAGDVDAARAAATGRLAASANDREALVALAKIALLDGDLDAARLQIARADILGADDVDSLLVKAAVSAQSDDEPDVSIALYEKAIAQARPPRAEAHFGLAMVLASARRFRLALAQFRLAVDLEPEVGPFHFHYAKALLADEQVEPGLQHLEKALALSPTHAPIYEACVFVLLEFGYPEAAEALLTEGLKALPGHPLLRSLLAKVMVAQGRLPRASELTAALATEYPDHLEALASRAQLLIADESYEEADALVRRMESMPATAQTHLLRARLCELSEPADVDGAISSYALAAQADPRDWASLNNLGLLLLQRPGNESETLEAAAEALEGAATRAPHRLEPLLNLALSYARLERLDEARALASGVVQRASEAQAELRDEASRLLKALTQP